MPRRFDLLVFDWDGTLMDSAAAIAGALQAACADLQLPVPSSHDARYVIGLGLSDAMRHLLPHLDEREYPRLVERYRYQFLQRDGGTTLFDGARELLQELHDEGYLLAVATGKSRRGLDRALNESGLMSLFHATRCADEGFAKPHPGMLIAVMEQLATSAEATLMIGDTTHDLEMAQAAGVAAVALTQGAHERTALARCQPLLMADNLQMFRDWLYHHAEQCER